MPPSPGGSPVPRANTTSTSGQGSADTAGTGPLDAAKVTITAAPTAVASRRTRFPINVTIRSVPIGPVVTS